VTQGGIEMDSKFNERILNEIINLRKTAEIVGMNQRINYPMKREGGK
jgi:hypothetical protein